ncbi:MAG: hypothetical protein DDT26_02633 [Dehalococcoidia bacterium]|nr:hypothetical protein [Chloroflexota bacterium]
MTDQPTFYTYRLYHRLLGYSCQVRASSAQRACEKLGWLIDDVWIICLDPVKYPSEWEYIPLQQLPPEKMKGV